MNDSSEPTKFEFYKISIETRNMEIGLFWQRSNYFLVLNTAIAIGFFSVERYWLFIALSGFGVVVSILWFCVNLGSKYWQTRWENQCRELEMQINKSINLFDTSVEDTDRNVEESLGLSEAGRFKRKIYGLVLRKPSVSFMMILLSIAFIVIWAVLLVASIISI